MGERSGKAAGKRGGNRLHSRQLFSLSERIGFCLACRSHSGRSDSLRHFAKFGVTRNMSVDAGQQEHYSLLMYGRPLRDEAARFRMASLLWMAGITLLLVPMATLVDIPIARWFSHQPLPREVTDALDLSLVYSHGSGIFLILVSVILMAPTRRWHVPRLASLALGGGAVATLAKMLVLRPRPNTINLDTATYDYAWIWSFDWTLTHVATFDASTRAFPSAYLATATALTVGLWVVIPRGRPLFVALCAGTMLQRMSCGAHFMSDLCGSAAVGLGWAYVCYHPGLMGRVFDKMEPEREPRRQRWIDEPPAKAVASQEEDSSSERAA